MALSPSDPHPATASTARGPFRYTDVGQGPCVVAVHGLPGSVRDFRHLGAALEPGLRLVRLDLPGFGGTPAATGAGVTLEARARFVEEALATLGLDGVVLLGHSMGGGVALVAAPSPRVRAVALLASIGTRPHRLLRRARGLGLAARLIDAPGRALTLRLVHAAFRLAGFSAATPLEEVAQTLRCIAALSFPTIAAAAAGLAKPTLTAFADDDPFIEPELALELAAQLPPGPRLRWPTGGHNVQKTHAQELAAVLVPWVRGL